MMKVERRRQNNECMTLISERVPISAERGPIRPETEAIMGFQAHPAARQAQNNGAALPDRHQVPGRPLIVPRSSFR
ncbi:MAG: hypothetical protein JNG88_05290 [Phycisphaerales bacterium]|nr:hypothetical protein [Phycisphaerales bacterium]